MTHVFVAQATCADFKQLFTVRYQIARPETCPLHQKLAAYRHAPVK